MGSKITIQPFATKKTMAEDSNKEDTGVNKPGNRQEIRDPTNSTREVPIGAATTKRTVCKETLQSLVTTFTNMELEIKAVGSPERQRQ